MIQISEQDVCARLAVDNPWWNDTTVSAYLDFSDIRDMPKRSYFPLFMSLAEEREVRRAIILMGPRRVGKTIMLQQCVEKWLEVGTPGKNLMFLSLETPIYTDIPLEKFVRLFVDRFGHAVDAPLTVLIDEIQYLRDWERHLTSLVNSFPTYRFIASGSAAAALKLKSQESGAGRFTEFLLPPLTFAEYLRFIEKEKTLIVEPGAEQYAPIYQASDIQELNRHFLDYLNIGGYPEAVFNEKIRMGSDRYIKSDIIDKVLLRDLPQLYGIRDTQELNRLFNVLAYNTGNEVSLDELSKSSGVSKTTLNKYLEYLEAAFLIKRVYRIDQNAKRFQRATSFKVYLTNPSMRSALFGRLDNDSPLMGALAETALFAQWFHDHASTESLHYARWSKGEIDMVNLGFGEAPVWCVEVKWSDLPAQDNRHLRHLLDFWKNHPSIQNCTVTTKTYSGHKIYGNLKVEFVPTSLITYTVSRNLLRLKDVKADVMQTPGLPSSLK
jgi:predicted AAA+ superfamily ATPase